MLIKEIKIPGSKSISNRLLILAAMCNSEIEISNIAESSDTKYLLECLEKLGAKSSKKKTL
jgi:3-phosphoshikimate 1-carboxyvinyltransferase